MNIKEKIYNKLPVFLQNIACNMEGKKIFSRRYSQEYFLTLDKIKRCDKLTKQQMRELQIERLKKQLIQAYENTTYYKDFFDLYDFDPYTLKELSVIEIFPIQTKDDIRRNVNNMLNTVISKNELISVHTSGTTGLGLIYKETKMCDSRRWATWWRYRNNIGISFDTWAANFGSKPIVPIDQKSPPYYRVVPSLRQVMFSMFHLNETTIQDYVDEINRKKIVWIHGFPSIIATMASLMIEKSLKINHEIQFITTGAEATRENQKTIIKQAFGIEPIGHYGLTEPVANISVCEYGKLHVDEDFSYVEFIPIDNAPANQFKLIGTSFANDAMLFLRYDTNDVVTVAKDQSCECKRVGRIINKVDGRNEDAITLKNGSKIWFLGDAFKDMVYVKEVQIYQYRSLKIDFNIVKSKFFTAKDEQFLREEIEKRIDVEYEIKFLNHIERYASNKFKFKFSFSELNLKK
jgi:phenylacetate-CoA ligase